MAERKVPLNCREDEIVGVEFDDKGVYQGSVSPEDLAEARDLITAYQK